MVARQVLVLEMEVQFLPPELGPRTRDPIDVTASRAASNWPTSTCSSTSGGRRAAGGRVRCACLPPEDALRGRAAGTPRELDVEVVGDLTGKGVWTLTPRGSKVHVHFDWRVIADRPLPRYLTPVPALAVPLESQLIDQG